MLRPLAPALLTALAVSSCLNTRPPPAAPAGLADNLTWFWVHGLELSDKELLDGATKLATAGSAATRTAPLKSQIPTRLTADELVTVGLDQSHDPSTARGLMIVNTFACTLDKLQGILIALDQKSQYTGVYDSYVRTYTSDVGAFTAGTAATLTWDVDLGASLPVNDAYTSTIKGGIRRVPGPADGATKGPFLVTRTWLPSPATFSPTSTSYFKQDYQIEIFWEETPGTIFHAYGMWREIKDGGFGLTLEDNGFLNIVLDNLVSWDDKSAALCKA